MRALRAVLIGLLVLAASGTAPTAAACLLAQGVKKCEGTCARCTCKRAPAGEHLRGPCPCCQPRHHAQAVTLLPPAVLPAVALIGPPPPGRLSLCASDRVAPFDRKVIDPPPRPRLLA